jgi:P2-related tail formation protein
MVTTGLSAIHKDFSQQIHKAFLALSPVHSHQINEVWTVAKNITAIHIAKTTNTGWKISHITFDNLRFLFFEEIYFDQNK